MLRNAIKHIGIKTQTGTNNQCHVRSTSSLTAVLGIRKNIIRIADHDINKRTRDLELKLIAELFVPMTPLLFPKKSSRFEM